MWPKWEVSSNIVSTQNTPNYEHKSTASPSLDVNRRRVLAALAGLGVGNAIWCRALAAQVSQAGEVTTDMIVAAEWIAGIELGAEERKQTADALQRTLADFDALRAVDLDYDVPPALIFMPAPQPPSADVRRGQAEPIESHPPERPSRDEDLAFLPVTELAALVRQRKVSSTELTKLYLARLRRFDPLLKCVMAYTEETALAQAARADQEIAAGRYRGPLHGIPWGAKDLIAFPGYPTTWGATPFKDRTLNVKATVVERLEQAGAVLVAKLALGALAQGDRWFDQMTRNPWNPQQGSSGSSAGSASAVAAGLVGFALGSETLGSIVSPCRRCGATGLRPTYGRVSRHGCMSLSWSMDKIGPITRSVEDCALILDAIHGVDGQDFTVVDRPFDWPPRRQLHGLRVGYMENGDPADERAELKVLSDLGVQLVPVNLPGELPTQAVTMMLGTEVGAVFDPLMRKGITEGLNDWPSTFRKAQFIPAVEYLRAARVRTLLIRAMNELLQDIDLYVGGDDLAMTNLTGHPTVVLPNGFRDRTNGTEENGVRTPTATTFTGRLYGETDLLAVAHHYQQATDFHLERPPLERFLREMQEPRDVEQDDSK